MPTHRLLYLSQREVAGIGPSMTEIIQALEIAFRAKGEGRTEMPPKPSIHPCRGDNFMNVMLAYIPDLKSAGVKWVGGFPDNPQKGFPYIPDVHADLGEMVCGQKPGRETPAERTMTANLGNALDDMAVAPLIYRRAVEKGVGTWLEL